MAKKDLPFNPDWVVHPGGTLREWREENHLPPSAAAIACARMPLALYEGIEAGVEPITKTIAVALAHGTSIPATLWLNLERIFRAGLAAGKRWWRADLREALAKGMADALTIDWPAGDTRLTTAPAIADYLLARPEVVAALSADPLRAAATRLCAAIADKAAIEGLIGDGISIAWQRQMDVDSEYITALKATRTALDGRPR